MFCSFIGLPFSSVVIILTPLPMCTISYLNLRLLTYKHTGPLFAKVLTNSSLRIPCLTYPPNVFTIFERWLLDWLCLRLIGLGLFISPSNICLFSSHFLSSTTPPQSITLIFPILNHNTHPVYFTHSFTDHEQPRTRNNFSTVCWLCFVVSPAWMSMTAFAYLWKKNDIA